MSTTAETLHTLGEDAIRLHLDSASDIQRHIIAMGGQLRRRLLIFSPTLTHSIYDSEELSQAITRGTFDNPHLSVQILIGNPRACVGRFHRLIDLAQKLSTYVEIRQPPEFYQSLHHDYFLVDKTGYVFREHADRFTATVDYNAPRTVDSHARQFSTIWQSSTRVQEFLRLYI